MADYTILNYGAISDESTNNSEAIQKAIDECNASGGGLVIIPTGNFLSGTLILRSNVNLHLESAAFLIRSIRSEDLID